MAKDPAILWYWNDWQGGTATFTRHLKGCYIDLLSAQFNSGRLSLAEIKTVLGTDFGPAWPTLQKKFIRDENGLFYNARMEDEKMRRAEYKNHQAAAGKKGAEKRWKEKNGGAYSNPKGKPNNKKVARGIENENKDEVGIGNSLGRFKETLSPGDEEITLSQDGFFSDQLDKELELTEMQVNATVEFLRLITKLTLHKKDVLDHWSAFKITQFGKHEWYNSPADLINHFMHTVKLLIIKNGHSKTSKQSGNAVSTQSAFQKIDSMPDRA